MSNTWSILTRKCALPANAPHLLAALVAVWLGANAFRCYGAAHWAMSHALSCIQSSVVDNLQFCVRNTTLTPAETRYMDEVVLEAPKHMAKLFDAKSTIMRNSSSYHLAGLVGVLFWIWGLRTKPVWLAILFIPVPLFGLFLFLTVM